MAFSRPRSAPSDPARICAARMAAFSAPSMATVATGMPEGICTVDSSASRPSSVEDFTGTPMTGSTVLAAAAPARWAALPAAAMIAPKPLSSASRQNFAQASGVRCAERTRTSKPISRLRRRSMAFCITPRSLSLPMRMATLLMSEFPPNPFSMRLYHTYTN